MTTRGPWRKVERRPAPVPDATVPKDFESQRVSVYRRGRTLILTGDIETSKDPDGAIHNCDALGCGWEHVIAVVQLTAEQERQFEVLWT